MEHSPSANQEVFAKVQERISYWQATLAQASDSEFIKIGVRANKELDELWSETGLMDADCLFGGEAVWPEIVSEPETETDSEGGDTMQAKQDSARTVSIKAGKMHGLRGKSIGFNFTDMHTGDRPRLWYMFEMFNFAESMHPAWQRDNILCGHVTVETAEIMPIEHVEASLGVNDLVMVAEGAVAELNNRSEAFKKMLQSTSFRRLKHHVQIALVDEFITNAEIDTKVRGASFMAEPEYGYRPLRNPDCLEREAIMFAGTLISGKVMALSMAGRDYLDHKAIRKDLDLLSKHDGLCLTVEVDAASKGALSSNVGAGSILDIPISGQNFELTFSM